MIKQCQTLILGASYAGLGRLFCDKDAVLLEETEVIGNDYTGIFRPSGQVTKDRLQSPVASDFLTYCEENGAVTGETLDSLWLSTVTYRYASEHALGRIFFGTALLGIVPVCQNGRCFYEVSVRSNEGIAVIEAERIMDTTALRISDRKGAQEQARILHAVSTDLAFHALSFPPKTEIFSARTTLEAYSEAHPEIPPFACVGFDFEYRTVPVSPCDRDGILWLNPSDYETPFDAMDAGATAAFTACLTEDACRSSACEPNNDAAADTRICTYSELRSNRVVTRPVSVVFESAFDYIVCGLGAGGSLSAYSAAKEGLSVLGLERGNAVGGMSVQGCVNNYYNSYEGGSFEIADQKADEKIGAVYAKFTHSPDAKKVALQSLLEEQNVRISFRSVVLGVYLDVNRVIGVRALQNGEIHDYACRFLADGTSDGHLMRILGVKGSIGRPSDGKTQPFTSVRIALRQNGSLSRWNNDSGLIDPYDDLSFSDSLLLSHGSHAAMGNPKEARFLYVSPLLGIREGMMIDAEEMLTITDIVDERKFDRVLIQAYSDIDKHGEDHVFDSKEFQDWFLIANLSTITWKIPVPLGAVVPKGLLGIVSVSRAIGADNYASAAVRMTRDMYRMGEAVGIFIAEAVKQGCASILQVPFAPAHEKVLKRGCYDPRPAEKKGFMVWGDGKPKRYVPVEWMTEWDEIRSALSGSCPGVAFWSVHRIVSGLSPFTVHGNAVDPQSQKEVLTDLLFKTMEARTAKDLTYAAAIALGFSEDRRAIPVLREMVKLRDAFFYLDNRRSNQLRACSAILLLSRFGDEEILLTLYKILTPAEYYRPMYHKYMADCYKLSTEKEMSIVYYYYLTYTVAALTALSQKLPHRREEILRVMQRAVNHPTFEARLTELHGAPKGSILEERILGLREWVERIAKQQNAAQKPKQETGDSLRRIQKTIT